jgi:hypothetical protein
MIKTLFPVFQRIVVLGAGILAFLIQWVGCSASGESNSEHKLIEKVANASVYDNLVYWVDTNITQKALRPSELELEVGTNATPLSYRVIKPFDWSLLGLRPINNEVRLLCGPNGEWLNVQFGNLRYGVIVSLPGHDLPQSPDILYRNKRAYVFGSEPK